MARVCISILLTLVTAVHLILGGRPCPKQFIRLGNFCYHFSDIEEDWVGARGFCKGIGVFEDETIWLGVLDFGLSLQDNQLLLSNASARGGTFWVGGSKDSSRIWRWTDHRNREIDQLANYWGNNQPNIHGGECLMVSKKNYRSYVEAANCSRRRKIICQIIPKEIGFRSIGKSSFYFSSENNITPNKTWQEARDFCMSLQPPKNFDHADLAVLGLNRAPDQELLKVIAQQGDDVWLGGHYHRHKDDYGRYVGGFIWIDGRSIEPTSYFWHTDSSASERSHSNYFAYATVTSTNGHARSYLKDCYYRSSYDRNCPRGVHFVCQAFKSNNNTI
ncbi:unnamed protein product, partial [Meganyctiphanes norvegica]